MHTILTCITGMATGEGRSDEPAVLMGLISEGLDDAAISDTRTGAFTDHPLKLGLERCQAGHAMLNLREPGAGNFVGGGAGLVRGVL